MPEVCGHGQLPFLHESNVPPDLTLAAEVGSGEPHRPGGSEGELQPTLSLVEDLQVGSRFQLQRTPLTNIMAPRDSLPPL
jgi:hypothetical protein